MCRGLFDVNVRARFHRRNRDACVAAARLEDDVVFTDAGQFDGFAKAHGEAFSEIRPANTTLPIISDPTALRNRSANMDVLIAMGSSVAYFYSIFIVLGLIVGHVYFETAAVIITLIRLGKYLEARAKGRTSEAIKKIDKTTRERFSEAFTVINGNFERTFQTLFGGGRAGLTLLDDTDALEGLEPLGQQRR